MREQVEKCLRETGIVAIARHLAPEFVCDLADALHAGGVEMLEVTMNTEGAAEMIRTLRSHCEGKMYVGAGTVTDLARLDAAAAAGAQFIVTPNLEEDVVRRCEEMDLLVLPGVMTPTEICRAMALGCRYMKLFPAGALGAAYMKAVLAPLSEAKLIAVGGIDSTNLAEFLAVGAVGAGVGGSLCGMKSRADAEKITCEAKKLRALCSQTV